MAKIGPVHGFLWDAVPPGWGAFLARYVAVALLLVVGGIVAFSGDGYAALQLQTVATGLARPVAITNANDGTGRLFITSQRGRIRVLQGGQLLPAPFLNITSRVSCCGERGLLSVAFHPNYATNGFFFVNYTNLQGNTVVARYRVSNNPNRADPLSRRIILTVAQPFANHNGGQLQFGPDGFLYIGMGDGGSAGDPLGNGQNLGTLLGKILRIDVNGALPYAIPPGNPFVNTPGARPEIWALGLRNPWRFSFDRRTGALFIGDVGQNSWEEIDFQSPNSTGGENYGWNTMEGRHCFNPPTGCSQQGLRRPIIEYSHTAGCSVTGGYRYRGALIPQLVGTYLYADFCSGNIWGARFQAGIGWVVTLLHTSTFQITSFGEDEAGEVYFTDLATGTIFRITGTVP